jgi:UDP-N-acetylmuramate: L-alanyl-gamma-D-glutamyl-meso-diaminopimelate ligase
MTDSLLDLDPSFNHAPKKIRSIHIMGICGTAMAAMAGMLKDSGYRITGSDSNVYPPMSDLLTKMGIELFPGYAATNLSHLPDLVIVGNVITRKNPEAQALAQRQLPYLSMPQALSSLYINGRRSLVIAGTHGKTTTSSMLASALYSAGTDPGFMIGGVVHEFGANYRIGNGPFFVVEGDEYDTAFFDKESKFLHYQPEVAVITSVEFDHADIFVDLETIKKSFRKFVSLMPSNGLLIANLDDENVADVVSKAPCKVQSYGFGQDRDYRIGDIVSTPGKTSFELFFRNELHQQLSIKLPGAHNCLNAAAVAAIMHHLGINPEEIESGLRQFGGVKRRQEIRGVVNDITVIDDFAHHPTAVRETLHALKQTYAENRLIAVFEPRTNTSRRAFFQDDYATSFDSADLSLIREPVQKDAIEERDCFSSSQLVKDIGNRGGKACCFPDTDSIIAELRTIARPGDIIAVLSNGGFDNIHQRLLETLAEAE